MEKQLSLDDITMPEHHKIEELTEGIKQFVMTHYELNKLEIIDRTTSAGASLISRVIVLLASMMCILFISIWAGFYLSEIVDGNHIGFAIVAGFYFLVTIILLWIRRNIVEASIRNKMIQKIFNHNNT